MPLPRTSLHEFRASHFSQTPASWGKKEGREQKGSSYRDMLTSGALGEEVSTLESSMGTGVISWAFEHFCHGLPDTSTKTICSSSLGVMPKNIWLFFYLKKGNFFASWGRRLHFLASSSYHTGPRCVLPSAFSVGLLTCSYFKPSSQKLSSYTGMLINMS